MFYSTSLPKSPGSAAQARLFLDQVRDEVSLEVLENARLLVSELVANSIEHVREDGDIELRLDARATACCASRCSTTARASPRRGARAGSDRGWGLHFVDRLASRWAIDRDGRARVWFELLTGD